MKIKSIDEYSILERLKASKDKEALEYINSLKQSIENWKDIAKKAIKNLRND